ncbi:synaptotagmin-11 isoform X2 [Acipenser ruthenus]|uniref:synaptotagmin-11 isoform X2 n=1 Tax=Acipenser ruthenus TaxID=7906 RepID=UPI0027404275|nr:synaptotagmin-11 isoform X2 [Acipenser ruthenus]
MAEITNIRPAFDVSPVLAGFIGAGVLVLVVSLAVFVWTCCHRRYHKSLGTNNNSGELSSDPPYKFIHMLKGISIYPESLSGSKKIVRVVRRAGAARPGPGGDWGPNTVLVEAAPASGSRSEPHQQHPRQNSYAPQRLPIRADYSPDPSPEPSLGPSSLASSKMASPFTPLEPEEAKLGTLSFSVDYNFPKKALVVTIQEAHGLPAVDEHAGSSDPYIKMTILPEKKHRVKTRVLRKTLEPVFDETFTFYGVPYSGLQDLVLHFLVLSFDRFARDDVIGEVVVPLSGVDPSTGKVQLQHDIVKRTIQCVSRGELLVSLSYQPVTQRLNVVVLKAKHLPKMDITGLSGNPYVKVNVFYGRKRIAKKKTHVKKSTLNPVFNESFIYDVPAELLPDITVEFLVIDFDRTTKNEVVGRLVLGAHSPTAAGATHWKEVCDSPRRQFAKWHCLGEH